MSKSFSAHCAQCSLAVQVSRTKENIYEHGKDTAEKYSTEEYGNLDTYQVPHQQTLPQPNARLCTVTQNNSVRQLVVLLWLVAACMAPHPW